MAWRMKVLVWVYQENYELEVRCESDLLPVSKEHVYCVGFYTIPYIRAYLWSWHTWPAAKEATYYTGGNVQSNHWTGSILRSSSYDLIDRHWFLQRYLVVFKVSFRDEVVTPGVTVASALTSAECLHHTSSIWPWSGMPKVCLHDTFLGGLRHSPPQMKTQHGLNEEKNHTGKNTSLIYECLWCDTCG